MRLGILGVLGSGGVLGYQGAEILAQRASEGV